LEAQQQQQEKKNRVVKTGGYKGDGDEVVFIEEGNRDLQDWVKSNNPCKLKIKGSDADAVLNKVYEYFVKVDKREKKIDVSKTGYRFTVEYDLEKEVEELGLDVEKMQLEVCLSKSEDDLIVEFMKKSGEKFEFYDIFENLNKTMSV